MMGYEIKCRLCGARIRFVKTVNGKMLPVNPHEVAYWKGLHNKSRIVTPNGEVISCELQGDPSAAAGIGYIPHWATCRGRIATGRKQKETQIDSPTLF